MFILFRESFVFVDVNSFKEKDKNRCFVGCFFKDMIVFLNGKGN